MHRKRNRDSDDTIQCASPRAGLEPKSVGLDCLRAFQLFSFLQQPLSIWIGVSVKLKSRLGWKPTQSGQCPGGDLASAFRHHVSQENPPEPVEISLGYNVLTFGRMGMLSVGSS